MTVIDAAVHPRFATPDGIRRYLPREWAVNAALPGSMRFSYLPPVDDLQPRFAPASGDPGSDPALLRKQVLDDPGVDAAILVPLGRGVLPNLELGTAVAGALNRWLAEEWLPADRRFFGSIRVNPEDVSGSLREIERWAGHPQMVQLVVPLQSHRPYGDRLFFPIWEAAAAARLPVAVHVEVAAGVDFWPTSGGYPTKFLDYSIMFPVSGIFHLASLIAEGVFERLADSVFVFMDGAFDLHLQSLWRMDKDHRPYKVELPWLKRMPSEYLPDHVRFLSQSSLEGSPVLAQQQRYLEMCDAKRLLMFGSEYPYWDYADPRTALAGISPDLREPILGGTAARLYRIAERLAPLPATARP